MRIDYIWVCSFFKFIVKNLNINIASYFKSSIGIQILDTT